MTAHSSCAADVHVRHKFLKLSPVCSCHDTLQVRIVYDVLCTDPLVTIGKEEDGLTAICSEQITHSSHQIDTWCYEKLYECGIIASKGLQVSEGPLFMSDWQ